MIIGGGIGGLFAANALIGQGLRVSVYEQASALGEVGAGVFVTPNAVRHLERVDLGPAVEKWGARVGPGSYYFRHDGTPIAPVQVTDAFRGPCPWHQTFTRTYAKCCLGLQILVSAVQSRPSPPFHFRPGPH